MYSPPVYTLLPFNLRHKANTAFDGGSMVRCGASLLAVGLLGNLAPRGRVAGVTFTIIIIR